MSQGDVGTERWPEWQAAKTTPSHSHCIGWFASAGLGFLRWKFTLAWALLSRLWFGLFVSIATTRTLFQKSPQGEGVEDPLDRPQ